MNGQWIAMHRCWECAMETPHTNVEHKDYLKWIRHHMKWHQVKIQKRAYCIQCGFYLDESEYRYQLCKLTE